MVKQTIKASLRAEELTFLPEPMLQFMEKQISIVSHLIKETHIMSFQNQISLAGRVSQDIRLNVTGERAILNGTIAVQKSYKDKETGEFGVDFFDFVIFSNVRDGKSYAQTMAELLKKGMYIGITGELSNRPVSKTKDGQDFYNDSNVIVNNLQLLESKDAVELRESKKAESAK